VALLNLLFDGNGGKLRRKGPKTLILAKIQYIPRVFLGRRGILIRDIRVYYAGRAHGRPDFRTNYSQGLPMESAIVGRRKVRRRRIYVVDDVEEVCVAVRWTLERTGCEVRTFRSPAACLRQLRRSPCHLLITDVRMPEMDGMELLREVKRIVPLLPVIVITGYGDVPKAVKAMRAGAEDYIEKPLSWKVLLPPVRSVLRRMAMVPAAALRPLTRRQLEVMPMVLAGMSNPEIADVLCRTCRTVEDHVRHILRKHGVKNRKELIVQRARLGLL